MGAFSHHFVLLCSYDVSYDGYVLSQLYVLSLVLTSTLRLCTLSQTCCGFLFDPVRLQLPGKTICSLFSCLLPASFLIRLLFFPLQSFFSSFLNWLPELYQTFNVSLLVGVPIALRPTIADLRFLIRCHSVLVVPHALKSGFALCH